MQRSLLTYLFMALALTQSVRGQEDPRDAERQFRFLLSRGDELQAQDDQFNEHTPRAVIARWKAQMHRLEGDYKHFLHDHPQHARAMVAYGGLLDDQGREDEAMRWWEKAIAADPREPYAYNSLANHYGHDGEAAKALQYYQKAIDLAPTEPIFRFNWATTCQLFRNESLKVYGWNKDEIFRHCLEQFRSARDLAPENFDLSSAYAETFYQMPTPDWPEAYKAWQFCLHQKLDDRNHQFVCANLARVCIRMGHYDEAKQWASNLTAGEQDTVRRTIERRIADLTKPARPPTSTNSPPTPAPEAGAKQ
jgi:tetratricopeptide (TPR) repeat protein